MERHIVGIADMKIAKSGVITSYGFGSCVGIVMYDHEKKLGGLLHIMLPDSANFEKNENPLKFADTGIKDLYQQLIYSGAKKENIVCKIAGGSQVYQNKSNLKMFDIGNMNIKRVKEVLRELRVPVLAEDLGGRCSRTIEFDVINKKFSIKKFSGKESKNFVL